MEMKCRKPITARNGDILFYANTIYKVVQGTQNQVTLKDELGCLRWFSRDNGESGKFFKEHFEEIKENNK